MQPDFSKLKPANEQPDFSKLSPAVQRVVDAVPNQKTVSDQQTIASKLNPVQNLFVGAGKGVLSTLQNIGNVIAKPVGKLVGIDQNKIGFSKESLAPYGTAQNIGNVAEKIGEFVVPGTKIAKATEALPFLGKLALRTAGDVGVSAVQSNGDVGEIGKTGVISAGVQTAIPAFGYGLKILNSMAKGTAGVLTGRGTDVIEEILKNPASAKQGLEGSPLKTLQADIGNIRKSIVAIAKQRGEDYRNALKNLPGGYQKATAEYDAAGNIIKNSIQDTNKFVVKGAGAKGEDIVLSSSGLKGKVTSVLKEHNVQIGKNGQPDFFNSTLPKSDQNILRQVQSDVNNWKDTSPEGLNRLAIKVGNYVKQGEQSAHLNGMLADIKSGIRTYVGERIPQVAEANANYAKQSTFLSELQTYLGKVTKANDPEEIKVAMGKLQTLFTKNKEMAREVLAKLSGGEDIVARQAGRELSTQVARSTSAIGSMLEGVVNAVIPPKVIGEIVAATGMATQEATNLVNALQKIAPGLRKEVLLPLLRASLLGASSQTPSLPEVQPVESTQQTLQGISSPNSTTYSPAVQRLLKAKQ